MTRGVKILAMLLVAAWCSILPSTAYAAEQETQGGPQTEEVAEPQTETEGKQGGAYDSKQTFGIDTELDGLSGSAKYLGSQYRDNYKLDLEKTGITEILDAGLNAVANMLFSAFKLLGTLACAVVYFCLDFSFADAFSGVITDIQSELIGGVYQQLWLLAVMILAGFILIKLAKKDLAGILVDFSMVILVSALSILMVKNSSSVLTATTDLTKSVAESVFSGLDGVMQDAQEAQNGKGYAKNAVGALWVDLIHVPWLTMEFGDAQVDDEVVEQILSLEPGSSDRTDIVEDLDDETGCFDKGRGVDRLGMLLCYAIPFTLKIGVFIAVALMQMLGQFLAVFVILLATFVLVLAMIPSYGMSVLKKWVDKFVDVHLSMMILSFLLAIMIWLNKVIFSYAGTFGWFITLLIQSVICLLLVMNYRTILFMLLHPRDGMQDIQRVLRMMARQNRREYGRYETPSYGNRGSEPQGQPQEPQNRGYVSGQWEQYGQDPYGSRHPNVSATAVHQTPPSYGYSPRGQDNENVDQHPNGEPQAPVDYQPPEDGGYSTVSEMEGTYAQDYEAIRNAPTQQEIYELYEDEVRNRGKGIEGAQDPDVEDGGQDKPIRFRVTEMELDTLPGNSGEQKDGPEEAGPPYGGKQEPAEGEERKAYVEFQEAQVGGQDGSVGPGEKIRIPQEETNTPPIQEALPQAGNARTEPQGGMEFEDPEGKQPEKEENRTID